jgi:hypothetical protein
MFFDNKKERDKRKQNKSSNFWFSWNPKHKEKNKMHMRKFFIFDEFFKNKK